MKLSFCFIFNVLYFEKYLWRNVNIADQKYQD